MVETVQGLVLSCTARFREAGIPDARMVAIRLLSFISGISENDCLLGKCLALTPDQTRKLDELCQRRAQGEPEQYLTGRAWFMDELFHVGPGVLIPRPDSEILAAEALSRLQQMNPPDHTLSFADVCTGSGCIGLSIALVLDRAGYVYTAVLTDCSEKALGYAKYNLRQHKPLGDLKTARCDLFPEDEGSFDLIVSNPPYIPTADIAGLMPEVALHEPGIALDGGEDGLCLIRRILKESASHLCVGGWLLLEHGYNQGDAVRHLFQGSPAFDKVETIRDFGGKERVTVGRFHGLPV